MSKQTKSPTFDDWCKKYFSPPKLRWIYKSKSNGDIYTEEELRFRYNAAYTGEASKCCDNPKLQPMGDGDYRCRNCGRIS